MPRNRFSKMTFRNGKETRNRVVVPPMASQTADAQGFATSDTVAHYARLARSGAGLIFVEYSYVHPSGKGEPNQLGADDDRHVDGLARIAAAIQASGALAGLQLVHVGGKGNADVTGLPLMAPSPVRVPVKGWEPSLPREMACTDIENWIRWFTDSARRAARAGFDFVELHAAHGYGLNQWLSPLTNQRADAFGGTTVNRCRLLVDIVRRVRSELPDLLVSVRLPAQDHIPGGLTIEEMQRTTRLLEESGVDLIDVSSGIGGWKRPEGRAGEGYLVDDAASIKLATQLPVIGVGGIESGPTIDQMISGRKIEFAAVGRAILKDPEGWGRTHLNQDRLASPRANGSPCDGGNALLTPTEANAPA